MAAIAQGQFFRWRKGLCKAIPHSIVASRPLWHVAALLACSIRDGTVLLLREHKPTCMAVEALENTAAGRMYGTSAAALRQSASRHDTGVRASPACVDGSPDV